MESRTLLLVEDDPGLALVQTHWLIKAGYHIIHVLTGEKAIEVVTGGKVNVELILMDINLGEGIDGTEAAQEILKHKDIPILFLSSHKEQEFVEKTEKITSYGYVIKDSKDVILLASINMAFKLHDAKKEIKARQDELVRSEHNYYGLINSLTESIYILNEAGVFIDVNDGAVKMYGYSREELIGKTPEFVSAPGKNDLQMVFAKNKKVFTAGGTEKFEFWGRRKNGEVFPKEVILNKGRFFGQDVIIAAARDITDHKQLEYALRISEERHRTFLENLKDVAYESDLEGNVTYINKAAESITGKNNSDLIGKSFLSILEEESQQAVIASMDIILKMGSLEIELHLLNGKVLLFKSELRRDHDGNVIGTLGIGRDITERKIAEEAIQHHTNEITNLYEITRDLADLQVDLNTFLQNIIYRAMALLKRTDGAIYLYDREQGDLVLANATNPLIPIGYRLPIGEAMAGKVAQTREPMIIDDYSKWTHRLPLYDGIDLTAVIEVPMLYRGELIGVLAIEEFGEGARKFTEDDMRLLTIFAGQAAGAVQSARMFQDIQISNATKDKFFSIIAHDLRSPFHGMLGLADILIEDVDSLNKEEMKDQLDKLKMVLTQQYELLSDLLEWARLQMGSFDAKPETISLNKVVDIVLGPLTLFSQQKKINLQNIIADRIKVFADRVLLGIVIRNLISNSIKFTKKNGTVTITAGNKDRFVEITVQDTGVGIPKEAIDQIFRIDMHYSTDGTAREKGTGLGLILCKEIIEKSGGNIRVESEIGKGSKFIFTLPAEG